jgi:HlyD family secretion protein
MGPRRLLTLAGCIAVAAGAGYLLLRPEPVLVETAIVGQGRFVAAVVVEGRTRICERYVVSAPVAGRLDRVRLKAGDRVARGDVVAVIRPSPPPLVDPRVRRELEERLGTAEAQAEEAEAAQASALAAHGRALADFARTRELRARGVAPAAAFDRDKALADQTGRDLAAAERRAHAAVHRRAEAAEALRRGSGAAGLEAFDLEAPIDGVVLRVAQENETATQPGMAILELGDVTDLEVIADPLTTEAVEMRPGAEVVVGGWGGRQPLSGRLRVVEPSAFTKVSALGVEEQRTWVVIELTSPPEARATLGDGFRVEARVTVEEIDRAILVPAGAIFRRDQGWHVFVLEHGRARLRGIEILRHAGGVAAVAAGLQPGMPVIVFPPSRLADGAVVRTR